MLILQTQSSPVATPGAQAGHAYGLQAVSHTYPVRRGCAQVLKVQFSWLIFHLARLILYTTCAPCLCSGAGRCMAKRGALIAWSFLNSRKRHLSIFPPSAQVPEGLFALANLAHTLSLNPSSVPRCCRACLLWPTLLTSTLFLDHRHRMFAICSGAGGPVRSGQAPV